MSGRRSRTRPLCRTIIHEPRTPCRAMTETNPPNSPSPKRVLVVDDVAPVVNTIKAMLAQFGHEVDFAPNGREALAMYQPCKYDLVITDYSMPTLDGLELAKAIKKQAPEQLILLIS